MSKVAFHRPVRTFPPSVPDQRVALAAPPQKPAQTQASSFLYILLPLLSSISMAAYMVTAGRPWMIFLGIGFVVLSVGLTAYVRTQAGRAGRRAKLRQRDRYMEYLADVRSHARESSAVQRAVGAFQHPSPRRLWALATGRRRVWERRPSDPDFMRLRLGLGRGIPAMQLALGKRGDLTAEYDPKALEAVEKLSREYAAIEPEPAWVDLAGAGVLSLLGPRERTRDLAGTLLLQLGVLHAPDDVQVAALIAEDAPWSWAKWLPHTHRSTSAGTVPMVSETMDGIADILRDRVDAARKERAERTGFAGRRESAQPRRLVVVLDDYRPSAAWADLTLVSDLLTEAGPNSGIHVVCLVSKESEEPGRVDARARVDHDGRLSLESRNPALVSTAKDVSADECAPVLAEQTARALAPLRLSGEHEQVLSRDISLPGMLGVGNLADYDPTRFWLAPEDEQLLRLPIGLTGEGETLVLDLKESALGGIGPHGLVVGATGSGKSELLRTLVTGLTMRHAPEQLSFVLVDFKGGATFAGVTELPHVAGLITNLEDDLAMVDRVRAALQGEQRRRQQMLRDAGNVDSVREYQIMHAQGALGADGRPLEPMPYLMIVVDEFGELLAQRPDFIELFVQIGRVGRSLGMHLLLATQRLDEGRLRGLESHLSYRICLRTFSPAESRAVIGTPDAYRLPTIPGSAYLKVDESVYERFRVAHVSGAYQEPGEAVTAPVHTLVSLTGFGLRTAAHAQAETVEADEPSVTLPRPRPGQRTEMQVAVERVTAYGNPVHQVWLPPLPSAIELDAVLGPVSATPERGYRAEMWPSGGHLSFPVGIIDLPAQQQQRPMGIDLSGAHGHLAVVGAPQSGKSTLLRTALLSAMVTHTPQELQFVCVDFGGGTLIGLERAPHVSGVATRHEEARTRRAMALVRQLVEERERLFQQLRIDSASAFRRLRDEGGLPEGVNAADVVLVIDNWAGARAAVEEADAIVLDVAARGLGVGIHLLITANRWMEIRTNLRDNITGRMELRLNEPGESEISRPAARQLRSVLPGRGVVAPGNLFHTALQRLDAVASADNLGKAQDRIVTDLVTCWSGPVAPPIRVLPEHITPADLEQACVSAFGDDAEPLPVGAVPIGLRESDLAPAVVNMKSDEPHFMVIGDPSSGKTSFLRSWMRGLAARQSAWDIRFIVIDYRRSLLDTVPDDYIGARAGDAQLAAAYIQQVVEKLQERMPPADVTSQQLRERSWWSGPELYLVIDDYDLVAGAGGSASRGLLAPLADYLTQAADIGFHLVLARRAGGVSRAFMSDQVVGRLREIGTGGLILSGDPREGVILGDQRAARQAPGRGILVSRRHGASVVQAVQPAD